MITKIPGFGCDLQHSFVSEEALELPLKIRWKSEKFDRSYSAWQPVIDEERIYHIYHLGIRSTGLCAHDRVTGKRLWEFLFEYPGGAHQICCEAGRVYYSENGHICCADGASGKVLWRCNPAEFDMPYRANANAPLYRDGVIYVSGVTKNLCALCAEDCSVLWCYEGERLGPVSLYKERLYFTSARDDENYLYCLNIETRELLWQSDITELGRYVDSGRVLGGASGGITTIYQDKAFVSLRQSIVAFDTETGKFLWQIPGHFSVQPISDGKRLYIFNGKNLTAYDVETGEMIYQTKEVPDAYRISIGGGAGKSLLTTNNILLSGHRSRLFAFDTETGEILWEFWNKKNNGSLYLQPILYEGLLYVIDSSSHLYCFEPKGA